MAVQQGNLLIGRDASCQIDVPEDDEISRQHAQLEQRVDGVWIKDLGAMNKTEVNGQAVDEIRLKHGDRIEIGRTQFEFQLMDATSAPGSRRRFSGVQALTVAAIVAVFAVQGLFMFLQFFKSPVAPHQSEPSAEKSVVVLEPELQRALELREAEADQVVVAVEGESVEAEVAGLRAAVAELRGQVDELPAPVAEPTPTMATAESVPEPVAESETTPEPLAPATESVAEVPSTEESFPQRVEPPPLAEVPERPPERPTDEDPLTARARQMLESARVEVMRSNLNGADVILDRIQVMAPEFIPAYVERAALYEKRAMLGKAGEQWTMVMERSRGTPMYEKASSERQRLAQAEAALSTARKHLDARPVSRTLPRLIRIVSVDRERFPGNKDLDEMRLVRVNLKPRTSEGDLPDGAVEVRVAFFDRIIDSGDVVPTGGSVPEKPLSVEGSWAMGTARSVSATYTLKKGFRQEEEKATGHKRMYEGFRVQVYYQGELQDEEAQPIALLKLAMPEFKVESESSKDEDEKPVEETSASDSASSSDPVPLR